MTDTHGQQNQVEFLMNPRPELAGEVVTFKTHGCRDEIPLDQVRQALVSAGLDPNEAKDLLPANAFRRALRKMARDRTIDQVDDVGSVVKFQLTLKTLDDQGLVDYDREAVLSLDENGMVSCPESQEFADKAQVLIAEAIGHRTSRDVKSLVKRMFNKNTTRELFCINSENGGTYFVPERHRPFTAKVDLFLRELGGELGRFPVPSGTEEGNASIGSAINEGIEQYVASLDSVVENWGTGTPDATHERYGELYREAVFKAQSLQEFLGDKVSQLQARVEKSKNAMATKIMQLAAEKEEQSMAANDDPLDQQEDSLVDDEVTIS